MVNAQGLPLNPAIEVPEGSTGFTVGSDGIVTAVLAGDTLPSELGQITPGQLHQPRRTGSAGRQPVPRNRRQRRAGGRRAGRGRPRPAQAGGVLEGSNVQVVEAMVAMIAIQRAYEANAKVLDAASGMQQFLNQTV